MHEIVVVGETKPGDVMARPFVAVPYVQWETLKTAAQRVQELTVQLAAEKANKEAVLADYQAYMREHQVLKMKQERGGR